MSLFTSAIERNWPGYVISAGAVSDCEECTGGVLIDQDDAESLEMYNEASFSYAPCESCGSLLGGDRYNAHAISIPMSEEKEIIHIDICTDCVVFSANGDEPEEWRE